LISCSTRSGFTLIRPGYYPQLIALYKQLGVAFRKADFSYSFSLLSLPTTTRVKQITATMIYNGNSGLGGLSMPSLLDEPYHYTKGRGFLVRAFTKAWTVGLFVYSTMCVMMCFLRMLFLSMPILRSNDVNTISFAEWAEQTVPTGMLAGWIGMDFLWRDYTQTVLLPLFSAICTAPKDVIQRHPVEEFLGEFSFLFPLVYMCSCHAYRLYLANTWYSPLRCIARRSRRSRSTDLDRTTHSFIFDHRSCLARPTKSTTCLHSL
jgi:hypothetical protein